MALIDEKDLEKVSIRKWSYHHTGYAVGGHSPQVSMHRHLMGIPPKGLMIDHINGNKLDNRRKNLRFCDRYENQYNSKPVRTDLPRNVYWRPQRGVWVVRLKHRGKRIFVGYFKVLKEAKAAAKKAIIKFHGEFAYAQA